MLPNLVEHLAAFVEVADTGRFSAAARRLNRSVSTISYSLAQLESHCGFPLLVRGTKRAELTERGRALYAEAKSVLERARRFEAHAGALEKGHETRIRIAVDVLFPLHLLHDVLARFVETHEHVRLQFFSSSLNSLWEDLRRGVFDFSFSLLSTIPLDMEGRSLGQVVLSPIVATTHPLASLDQPIPLSAFQKERQIFYVGSPQVDLERVGRSFSVDVWTANDREHIRHLIRHGLGWCFATETIFREELRAGTARLLRCVDARLHPVLNIGTTWPVGRPPGALGRTLIEMVAETCRNSEEW